MRIEDGVTERIGSVLGSMLGGVMLSFGWGLPTVFALVGAPTVAAGVSVLTMGALRAGGVRQLQPQT